jgi:4'-phosphopantetheinyl transferase
MNRNGSDLQPGEIHLYFVDLRNYRCEYPVTILSPDERERARRYHSTNASLQYIHARCLLREVLSLYLDHNPGDIIFEYSTKGKPHIRGESLDGVQFNISHSGDAVAIIVSRGRKVGIDVEKIRDDIPDLELAKRFFSYAEAAAISRVHGLKRAEFFLKIWTRKEALLKATGEGIGGLGNSINLINQCSISHNGILWQVHDFAVPSEYTSAFVVEGGECFIKKREVSFLGGLKVFYSVGRDFINNLSHDSSKHTRILHSPQ